ncbi:alkyl hydroperoxide reductase [Flavipsychrobacter stenotrophus]|uniref:thioredoxin-dependent peroxiredoxin n=1 Tax=Flavipsychrobacter stenotrophus TaxID=2077091 RepID=A0A2S7T1U8_9BACT|nr:peroxiredoxin-like family protein [Flavipsychrobacter stenotrophus]PQJ12726.1 alkyl hydroperoxide reductase [Flavipsychrobacter stenotrophus]
MNKFKALFFISLAAVGFANLSFAQTVTSGQLKVGSTAPSFTAKDYRGRNVDLKAMTQKGKVILVFYRGQWCPYCNRYLSSLQDSMQLIAGKGATVVAISPEMPDNAEKTAAKTKVSFPIISDAGNRLLKMYKTGYTLEDATLKQYKAYGIDLSKANGNNENMLPVPATYIIDQNMKISAVFYDADYRNRPSVRQLVNEL